MNEVQIFNNEEFGSVRVTEINGEPWLVGKDVAACLGYGKGKSLNNAVAKHVDEEDKGVIETMTPGGKQKVIVINESGVYALVFGSKLPTAKKFKHWVTSNVLPTLRKTGSYVMSDVQQRIQSDPMFAAEYFAKNFLEVAKDRDRLAKQIEDEKPMVDLARLITAAEYELSVGDFAKLLRKGGAKDMGQNRLFQRFRDEGYLQTRKSEWNVPTQTSIEAGLFGVSVVPIRDTGHFARKAMVTPKGQSYFIAKYL